MGKLGDLNKEIITAVENAVTARERTWYQNIDVLIVWNESEGK